MAESAVENLFPAPSRFDFAMGNLAAGDFTASARALGSPESLTLEERKRTSDLIFGESQSVFRDVFEVVTDPFVAIGLALHLKFPVATAQSLFQFSKQVSGYQRSLLPGFRSLMSFGELFRGTPVGETYPQLIRAVRSFKEEFMEKFGAAVETWEKTTGKGLSRRDQIRLFAHMDGLDQPVNVMTGVLGRGGVGFKPVALSAADRTFVQAVRRGTDDVWGRIFEGTQGKEAISEVRGMLRDVGVQLGDDDLPKFLKNYMPHVVHKDKVEILKDIDRIIGTASTDAEAMAKMATANAKRVLSPSLKDRHFEMLPATRDLEEVKDLLRPGTLEAVAERKAFAAEQGFQYREYSMRLAPVLSTYVHGMGRTYGWTVKGFGKQLAAQVKEMEKVGGTTGRIQASMMRNTYLPVALGKHTLPQAMQALQWGGLQSKTLIAMDGIAKKMGESSPFGKLTGKMRDRLMKSDSVLVRGDAGQRLANYFYLSTLGGNPASAALNLFQTVLTTAPTIGLEATAHGTMRAAEKLGKYIAMRGAGMRSEEATLKAFGSFTKSGLMPTPLSSRAFGEAIEEGVAGTKLLTGRGTPLGRAKSLGADLLMTPFATSELFVRLGAFEGAMWKAAKDGIKDPEKQIEFGRRVVETTQFLTGPTSTPVGLMNVHPLLSQFTKFQVRFGEWLTGPGTTLGSGAQNVGGRNLGTLGRFMLFAGGMEAGAREFFGADLSQSLTGAFPGPRTFGPLAPLPIVPPAVSIAASLAQDVTTGEWDQSRYAVPLLVPGGVAASRMVGLLPGESAVPGRIAQFLGRERADWREMQPDGRVPVYSGAGAIKGWYTPVQIWMRAMKIPGVGDQATEQQFQSLLVNSTNRIREYRRQYMDAMIKGETDRAESLNQAHSRAFGFEIYIRPQDWKALRARREQSRTYAQIQRAPTDLQPMLMQAFQMVAASAPSIALAEQVDPGVIGTQPLADLQAGHGRSSTYAKPVRSSRGWVPSYDSASSLSPMSAASVQPLVGSP